MIGAHPDVLQAIVATNYERTPGYGLDSHSRHAAKLIREAAKAPRAEVKFLIGGTQTNAVVIDALLRRHQGVLAAETAHINVHESGAIEATGHKVIPLPHTEGKLSATDIDRYITTFYADDTYEHMVAPGMVYISFPTELGTIYSRPELEEIALTCRRHHIPLYIDGARLAYGLAASPDITLADIAALADVFYIGGTKTGTLFGEAVVARNRNLLPDFFPLIKQHGALLAKGRITAVQFEALFTNDLFMRIGHHAVATAMRLRDALLKAGFRTFVSSPTNQQFFELPNEIVDRLLSKASFSLWGPRGETTSKVRFVTDWATTDADIDALINLLHNPL